jgi:hypothetical protein
MYMRRILLVLTVAAMLAVMMSLSGVALAQGCDVCVSIKGELKVNSEGGTSTCSSQPGTQSRAVAVNGSTAHASGDSTALAINTSVATASNGSDSKAINRSFANANVNSEATAINRSFAVAFEDSEATATNDSCAGAVNGTTATARNGEFVSCPDP